MLKLFWWNVARYVRRHRLLALANVLGIALGIAVYLAIQIANRSANRAFEASVDLIAGKANIEIRGDVDEKLWPVIAQQPEVSAVTGILEAIVALPDRPGDYLRLVGVEAFSGAAFQTYKLTAPASGRFDAEGWMAAPNGIAVTREFASQRGLSQGSTLRAVADGRVETLTIKGIIEPGDAPVGDSHFAAMDIGWMQELLRRQGRLTSLQVLLKDPLQVETATASLAKLAPGLTVAAPARRSAQVGKMIAAFQLNLTALSMVSLLVGVFLIYNTVSASVARRRVQIGIMRALGVTSAQVRWLFLGEAMLYAIPGVLLGMAGGVALSGLLSGAVEKTVSAIYTLVSVDQLSLHPSQFILAAICGIGAALVGAWGPSAEAARVEPVDTLRRGAEKPRESAAARQWWKAGLGVLALGAVSSALALQGYAAWLAFGGALGLLVAAACFAPALLSLASRIGGRFGGALLLPAARRLTRSLRRNAITTGALATSVAMFIGLVVMVFSFRGSLGSWIGKGIVADFFVAPAANEVLGLNSYLPREVVPWLRARPEVRAADSFREQQVSINGRPSLLAVVDGEYRNNLTFLDANDVDAMRRLFAGEAAVVTEPFSRKFRIKAGDAVVVETPQGARELPIAGTYSDYSRDQGVLLVGAKWFRSHWTDERVMSAAVYLKPGANAAALEADFRKTFADTGQYAIHSSGEIRQRVMAIFDQTFAVTEILRTVAVFVAIAGVLLSMTTMVIERRRELALLRALGGGPSYVRGLVLAEAGLIGLSASVLGILAGVPLAAVLTYVVNPAFFGWTFQLTLPWPALAWTPVWVTAAAIVAAWWPATIAGKIEIAEALHDE